MIYFVSGNNQASNLIGGGEELTVGTANKQLTNEDNN